MRHAVLAALLVSASLPAYAAPTDELLAVARPRFEIGGQAHGSGTAFFLAAPGEAGAVAITTAHSVDLPTLSGAAEIEFLRGSDGARVSRASRLYTAPGRPFSEPGATLRDDYLVFALDTVPRGVEVLRAGPAPSPALEGQRVQIFGVPANQAQPQDDIFGTVEVASANRLEIVLDVPVDLRGWGGAPVRRLPGGEVLGFVQAAWPDADTVRIGAAPIDGVTAAMTRPLEDGQGSAFAAFRPGGSGVADADAGLEASADDAAGRSDGAGLDGTLASVIREPEAFDDGPLLGRAGALSTKILLELEHPADGAIVSDEFGAFIAGRALAALGEFVRFDVILAIDVSGSTKAMSGADINGNGIIGEDRVGGVFGGLFGGTDGGDSILASEIAAARQVMRSLDPRNTRVGIVTFAGIDQNPAGGGATIVLGPAPRPDSLTEHALSSDYESVDRALTRVFERGPAGSTNMTEGVRMAIRELNGFRGGISDPDPDSEKVVMFFTDGQPTLPYNTASRNVRSVLYAAKQARQLGIRVHTFAIGPDALAGPIAAVDLARLTGGYFTPVRHPGDLTEIIENVSFANIDAIRVRNLTTEQEASELDLRADGNFGALVPVASGRNRIAVEVTASDGNTATAEVTVAYAPGVPRPPVPSELVSIRNELLEERLVSMKRGRIEAEREQAEAARKDLLLEIEQERAAAEAAATRQRRDIQIEAEPDAP